MARPETQAKRGGDFAAGSCKNEALIGFPASRPTVQESQMRDFG